MPREIIFESHSSSEHNENQIASGHLDPPLSKKGRMQAEAIPSRYQDCKIDLILCSDLKRSIETAQIAFPKIKRIESSLLREWNYGIYNGKSVEEVDQLKPKYVDAPFPGGEDLSSGIKRILSFLELQLKTYPDHKIMIIGHRLNYYALEYQYRKRSFDSLLSTPWSWQAGWFYFVN